MEKLKKYLPNNVFLEFECEQNIRILMGLA